MALFLKDDTDEPYIIDDCELSISFPPGLAIELLSRSLVDERVVAGLDIDAAARRAGLPPALLSAWEMGALVPSWSQAATLLAMYDAPEEVLSVLYALMSAATLVDPEPVAA